MTTVTKGLAFHTLLGILQAKVGLARTLGKVPVTSELENGQLVRKWEGTPVRDDQHREIADAQMKSVLPRVLDGSRWDLTRALDAFLTALAHYSVAAGATFVVSNPDEDVLPDPESLKAVDAFTTLSSSLAELLAVLDVLTATISEAAVSAEAAQPRTDAYYVARVPVKTVADAIASRDRVRDAVRLLRFTRE